MYTYLLHTFYVYIMFNLSYTFERVQENSEKLWRFQRYTVINDYDWRIPSPLNIVFLPYRLFCCPTRDDCCLNWCRGMLYFIILRYIKCNRVVSYHFIFFFLNEWLSKAVCKEYVLSIFDPYKQFYHIILQGC